MVLLLPEDAIHAPCKLQVPEWLSFLVGDIKAMQSEGSKPRSRSLPCRPGRRDRDAEPVTPRDNERDHADIVEKEPGDYPECMSPLSAYYDGDGFAMESEAGDQQPTNAWMVVTWAVPVDAQVTIAPSATSSLKTKLKSNSRPFVPKGVLPTTPSDTFYTQLPLSELNISKANLDHKHVFRDAAEVVLC
eukprot:gnl/TRDRNA2_/TRDRNA2_154121_c0_seq1.p1 gnl/TRDRNA2_/TRDRNA2_154121_c0~~gnl/TRDRNA2_/TRDRNA2_154121_c0_seq1.p1  ORF type:complete len:189 (+),score=26.95 gnl/TRDRNA2_/TRDRNA2_154121_c0_seq1:71-637(+)